MAEANAAPGEDGREAREREHPVECVFLLVSRGEVGEEAEDGREANCENGTPFAVDVGEEVRRLRLFGQCGERAA